MLPSWNWKGEAAVVLTAGPLAELVLGNWKPLAAGTLVAALVLGNWNSCGAGVLAEVFGN